MQKLNEDTFTETENISSIMGHINYGSCEPTSSLHYASSWIHLCIAEQSIHCIQFN